jgi:TRAP-type C4-dicarboxylate transport system permease small subunit
MKAVKWLDEHFEETIIIVLLVVISVVELMQVICRNIPGIPALSWAEEMARYAWIITVFISLPYTIRTSTSLRVTALVELFPWKLTNVINIIVDLITAAALGILAWTSITVIGQVQAGGSVSPAMQVPMWIMYVIIFIGFAGGVLRAIQMCVIHIKNINVKPVNSVVAAAADELSAADVNADGVSAETRAAAAALNLGTHETQEERESIDSAIETAWTDSGKGDA